MSAAAEPAARPCWCGHPHLAAYSADYHVCRACGTLVSRAPLRPLIPAPANDDDSADLYGKSYWNERQTTHHGLPGITARARRDLPERCTTWLETLLRHRLPPGRVLEVGCGHGAFVALLGWAGFDACGNEMSPWVVDYARRTFDISIQAGPIEALDHAPGTFDVIVLNDVIEHFPEPRATLAACARLLRSDGFFLIQTPEYKEHLAHTDLLATNDLFLRHMDGNNDEHLYLFSRRSAAHLFGSLGYGHLAFHAPVFAYDMYFTASPAPLPTHDRDSIAAILAPRPTGRLVLALLDKAFESTDRWWAIQRLEGKV